MVIEWNKVTWYSRLLAIILFVLVFYIGFNLGKDKKEITQNDEILDTAVTKSTAPVSITSRDIKEENFTGTVAHISGSGVLATEAQKYIDQTVSAFKAQADAEVPEFLGRLGADAPYANYTLDISAKYLSSEKTESIAMLGTAYTGGAHPNSYYKVITASLESEEILSLSDVIRTDKQGAFTAYVKKELKEWVPDETVAPVVFPEEVENLKFESFVEWSLDNKNLILYFSQYEIGPGALGPVAFPLPLDKIKNFLEENYI